jgi:peptidyl-prolyl cis-trans isomerase B (cyclophilin B)
MKKKLLTKFGWLTIFLLLGCAGLAAQASANPQPTPKPTPKPQATPANAGKPTGSSSMPRPVARPKIMARPRPSATPAPAVKPPTASDQAVPLNPTTSPAVKPPTAGENPTPVTGQPDATPAVKPPTEAKDPAPVKKNARPATPAPEPYDKATVEEMAGQCVALDTDAGLIVFEVYPEHAPETVRSFLNLVASGALDTTTFSRIVKDFVIQGGNLRTSANWNNQLAARAARTIQDEPNQIKHERGVVSMARSDQPNSATTNFFILTGTGAHLDGTFSAFGRVTKGMEVADAINNAPAAEEKPEKPVRINRARVVPCKQ